MIKTIILIFVVAILISLYAGNIDPKLRLELEQFATKQGYNNVDDLKFIKSPSIVNRNVERYQIYNNEFRMGGKKNNYLCEMILVYQDSLYFFPNEYNRFVHDLGEEITEENVFDKFGELIKLWSTVDIDIEGIEWIKDSHRYNDDSNSGKHNREFEYNIEAISYSAKYGIRMLWNIGYKKGKFCDILAQPILFPRNDELKEAEILMNMCSFSDNHHGNNNTQPEEFSDSASNLLTSKQISQDSKSLGIDKSNPKSRLTYEERFMETLESSEKYNDPLLAKVFPDVEFYLQVSKRIGSDDFRIAALYQDKHYLMPSRFNEVYELIEEESTSIIEDRIGAYVKMIYIRRSERRYARTKEIMNVTDVVVSKDSSYVDIVRFNYKVEFKLEGKNRKAYFWIDDGQIKRIRIEDQIGSLSLIKPAVASKSRNIENN